MNCSKCKEEEKTKCGCEVTLSTDCSIYTGEKLECTYIKKSTKLTKILQKLDGFICNIKNGVPASLINIGKQNKIYRTIDAAGKAELRTVETANEDLLKIHQTGDEIEVEAGELKLTLSNNTRIQLSTNTNGVDTTLSKINLLDIKADATGAKGKKGKTGASAYDVWIRNGNSGTKQDYIDSLVGAKGLIGAQGSKGKSGADGTKGDKGDPGTNGTKGQVGDTGPRGLKGDPGTNGTNGTNGKDGTNGTNGTNGAQGPPGDKGDETCDCETVPTITIENIVVSTTAKNSKKCFDIVVSDGSTVNIETSFYADTTTQKAPTVGLSGGVTTSLTLAGTGINGTDTGGGIDSAKEDWTLTVNGTMNICIEAVVPPNAGTGETSDKLGVVRAGISFTDVGSVQVEATEVQ